MNINMIELTPAFNAAIGEIPYKYAQPLIVEISRQIMAGQAVPPTPVVEPQPE